MDLYPALRRLAETYGIAVEFWDWQGKHVDVPAATIVKVLAALEVDASSPEAAERAVAEHGNAAWRRMLPPSMVIREGWSPMVNVHVQHGDGTQGWPEYAPYDAIVVAAGGPDVPAALADQLAIGGRLVMPVGATQHAQTLVRIRRTGESTHQREMLGECRFVPLIGAQGWSEDDADAIASRSARTVATRSSASPVVANLISETSAPIREHERSASSSIFRCLSLSGPAWSRRSIRR